MISLILYCVLRIIMTASACLRQVMLKIKKSRPRPGFFIWIICLLFFWRNYFISFSVTGQHPGFKEFLKIQFHNNFTHIKITWGHSIIHIPKIFLLF